MARKTHYKTVSGKVITDDLIDRLAHTAETGYDVEETLRRRETLRQHPQASRCAAIAEVERDPEIIEGQERQ